MLDRDLDRKVTRTKGRPLASGELGTMQALGFLTGQLSLGLCGLLSLNVECVKQGLAIMPVVMIYPLMKRYTNWPQLVLGLAFNWGAIVGWTAVHGSVSWSHVIPLYGAGICWTIVYDTLYGHQDKKDDERLGIRSTAVLFGQHTKVVLAGFGLASVTLLGVTGYAAELSWPFYVGTLISGGHLARLVAFTDLDNPDDVFRSFKSNKEFGALVLASIVAGHW